MDCTRVLHAFGSRPQPAVMPVDLAVCLSLSQQQPLYQLLSVSALKPRPRRGPPGAIPYSSRHSSSSSSSSSSSPASPLPSSPLTPEPRSCFRRDGSGANKKRVVFADDKGLALAAVHLFTPECFPSPAPGTSGYPAAPQVQTPRRHRLWPDFPTPASDVSVFLARLRETHVQLESCSVSEQSLSGTVCVCHASKDRAVHVRVTLDSWRSHHDVPCVFLQQLRIAGSDVDVYSFDFILPQNADPTQRLEFCVSLRPGLGATPRWDDNRGLNYRVCAERDGSNATQGNASHYHPSLPRQRPRSGLSRCQSAADPRGFQRTLSSRVKGVKHFNQGLGKLAHSLSAAQGKL